MDRIRDDASSHARRGARRLSLLLGLSLLLLGGCRDGGSSTTPTTPPLPTPAEPRDLAAVPLETGERPPLRDRIDWSDDDFWILYAAGPASSIWRIAADGASRPLPVSVQDTGGWLDADYAPCALAGGRVAFFHGWYGGDRRLHLLATPLAADPGESVTVLHRFPATAVGLAPEQASSPQSLTLAADGCVAAGQWQDAYLLSWPAATADAPLTVHLLEGTATPAALALSRDGSLLAYRNAEGQVAWGPVTAPESAVAIGAGDLPAWDGGGRRLAWLSPAAEIMVWDREGDTLVPYRTRLPGPVVALALAWGGDRVALLVRGAPDLVLYVAPLQ